MRGERWQEIVWTTAINISARRTYTSSTGRREGRTPPDQKCRSARTECGGLPEIKRGHVQHGRLNHRQAHAFRTWQENGCPSSTSSPHPRKCAIYTVLQTSRLMHLCFSFSSSPFSSSIGAYAWLLKRGCREGTKEGGSRGGDSGSCGAASRGLGRNGEP